MRKTVLPLTLNHRVGGLNPSQRLVYFFLYPCGHSGLAAVTVLVNVPLMHLRVVNLLAASFGVDTGIDVKVGVVSV